MKLLVIDDDITNIMRIESALEANRIGIGRVISAINGSTGLYLIETELPDIVLCDIDMPQLNGITVLKRVFDLKIQTTFVFLTCYESFDFARDAIRFGAFDYMTKPFTDEELLFTLRKAVDAAHEARNRKDAEDRQADTMMYLINNFLQNLAEGILSTDRDQIDLVLKRRNIQLGTESSFRQVYVSCNIEEAEQYGWKQETFVYALRHISAEAIADRAAFDYAIGRQDGRFYIIILFVGDSEMSEQEIFSRSQEMVRLCRIHLKCSPVILIGELTPLYLSADVSREMDIAIKKLRLNSGQVIFSRSYGEMKFEHPEIELNKNKVWHFLQQRDKSAFVKQIGQIIDAVIMNKVQDRDAAMHLLHQEILVVLYGYLQDNNIQAHIFFSEPIAYELNKSAESSVLDMIKFASYMFDGIVRIVSETNESSHIISKVKQYVKDNYREELTRDDIAAAVYITPNYLSKLFRNETGTTLRDYITTVRLKEAQRLLTTTRRSISAISSDVGFNNISYFSTAFKKFCGVSPIDWRNKPAEAKEQECK